MRGAPYLMRMMVGIGAPKDTSMGVDFSGTVEAVGKNVEQFKPGDEVFGGGDGAFAEYLTVREDRGVVPKPENVSFEHAASVGIAGVTALQALRDHGKLEAGQKVLINGASGGVGTFAVQIAKAYGAEVTGVCSTRNLEMVRTIGADHVIDYKNEDYTEGGKQYDLIIDMVGNHSLTENRKVLTATGKLVMVGGSKGDWLAPLMSPIKALFLSPFVDQEMITILARLRKADLIILGDLMQAGKITPVIDRRYSLSSVADAIRYSEEGHVRGKLIIEVQKPD
jgi:NADPH:quinone reductase-like Zn-dependent oxidoreductase